LEKYGLDLFNKDLLFADILARFLSKVNYDLLKELILYKEEENGPANAKRHQNDGRLV
jgi:hypothetical protein